MSAPSFALNAHQISLTRADRPVLADIDLTIGPATRLAVVGPNGVGKSTLLRVLAGASPTDRGRVVRRPADLRVGLVDQELERSTRSVRDHLATQTGVAAADAAFEAAAAGLADGSEDAAERYEQALHAWSAAGAADFDRRVETTLRRLGLPGRVLDQATASLSGGEAVRVGLATVLLSRFDVTLLDEPTNNLDAGGLAVLEGWVGALAGGLVVVSHDRRFLEHAVTSVLEIDEHDHTATLFHGGWQAYLDERETARARAVSAHQRYVDERDRLRASAQRQREWVDRGVSSARKRPADGDKFRRRWAMDQTEQLAGRARATDRALERLEVVDKPWEGWDLRFTVATAPRSGAVVVETEDLVVQRGDFVLGPITECIEWGEKIHLAGPNGSGKSTFVAAVLGELAPTRGTCRVGPSVVVGVLGQERGGWLADDERLVDVFPAQAGLDMAEARSLLAKFGLDHDAVARPIRTLSPGERTRASLALFQAKGVNLVVLDEPSNHLDLPAIEQLEAALDGYDGTLLLISHDRALLDAVAITRTIRLG